MCIIEWCNECRCHIQCLLTGAWPLNSLYASLNVHALYHITFYVEWSRINFTRHDVPFVPLKQVVHHCWINSRGIRITSDIFPVLGYGFMHGMPPAMEQTPLAEYVYKYIHIGCTLRPEYNADSLRTTCKSSIANSNDFETNFFDVCFQGSRWRYITIGSDK